MMGERCGLDSGPTAGILFCMSAALCARVDRRVGLREGPVVGGAVLGV